MSDKEETDEDMRFMLARALVRDLGVNHVEARNMVNHWQDEVRAEAFNEGRVAQIMHDVRLSDAEWAGTEPPAGPPNPYQQEPNND